MKRFWLVLLSLGLIMAFSVSAYAVDVKFSGSMYAAGMYVNKTSLAKTGNPDGTATAFYFQNLRLQTEFVAAPGLSVITVANVMKRIGGEARVAPGAGLDTLSAATRAENENIGFDRAYISWASPIGIISAGYQLDGAWGTVFSDSTNTYFKLSHIGIFGKVMTIVQAVKQAENGFTFNNAANGIDRDSDKYVAAVVYNEKKWNAGFLYAYINSGVPRTTVGLPYKSKYHVFMPYVKANIGPVALQAEIDYATGKLIEVETGADPAGYKVDSFAGWIDATATFGPVYVGGTFAYSQGDNDATDDKTNQVLGTGRDWSPTLIMLNEDRSYWFGSLNGNGTSSFGTTGQTNILFYQLRAGVKPTAKLDVMLSASLAQADKQPAGYSSKDYGWEIDVTGTYKITNNLSYMLGVGYLVTGDYFKGNNTANEVTNDYLVINKLTLTF